MTVEFNIRSDHRRGDVPFVYIKLYHPGEANFWRLLRLSFLRAFDLDLDARDGILRLNQVSPRKPHGTWQVVGRVVCHCASFIERNNLVF